MGFFRLQVSAERRLLSATRFSSSLSQPRSPYVTLALKTQVQAGRLPQGCATGPAADDLPGLHKERRCVLQQPATASSCVSVTGCATSCVVPILAQLQHSSCGKLSRFVFSRTAQPPCAVMTCHVASQGGEEWPHGAACASATALRHACGVNRRPHRARSSLLASQSRVKGPICACFFL